MISNLRAQSNTAFKQLIIKDDSFKKAGRNKELEELKNLANNAQYKNLFDGFDHLGLDQEIVAYGDKLTSVSVTDKQTGISHSLAISERRPDPETLLGQILGLIPKAITARTDEIQKMTEKLKKQNWPVDS